VSVLVVVGALLAQGVHAVKPVEAAAAVHLVGRVQAGRRPGQHWRRLLPSSRMARTPRIGLLPPFALLLVQPKPPAVAPVDVLLLHDLIVCIAPEAPRRGACAIGKGKGFLQRAGKYGEVNETLRVEVNIVLLYKRRLPFPFIKASLAPRGAHEEVHLSARTFWPLLCL